MHQPLIVEFKWIRWQKLGVGLDLKNHGGCLGNWKGWFMTLLSAKQQKKKASKHIQSTLQAEETSLVLWHCLLFVEPKKPNNSNQIHQSITQPMNILLYITTFIIVCKAQKKP